VFGSPGDFAPLLEMASDPDWPKARTGAGTFRCLSAGCGTGEEAYSLAIALAETRARSPAFSFEVIGADLSARAVARARRGVYPASRGETIPPELRGRYFTEQDQEIAADALKPHVRFARLNLCEPDSLLPLGAFDLILARGFLSSLTAEGRRAALANLAHALIPGGILLLGPEDSIGESDLGLSPIRWGARVAYEAAALEPRAARVRDTEESPDPGLALVAHRSALARGWIRILLEQRGLRVEEAAHGVGALERVALGRTPSFFFLERTLPPKGAPWVLERLAGLGVTSPEVVVQLSPGGSGATLPLTPADLDLLLEPTAP
jgi:chemotaxis methyl-accepting protein methylase/CheY-like chemotaxis protein